MSWIKCSERMPPRLEKVLAVTMPFEADVVKTGLDGKVLRSIDCGYVDQQGNWHEWMGPLRRGLHVTHWQPLPALPEVS